MHTPASLTVVQVALDGVARLRPLLEGLRRHDRSLEDQIRRASSSVVLNLAEAARCEGGNRRMRLETADGSLSEARVALKLATAWGYIEVSETEAVDAQLDRV